MKFTCSALMLGALASTSLGEISNYNTAFVSYLAETDYYDTAIGGWNITDEFDDLYEMDVASFHGTAGGDHLWHDGDLAAMADSQGFLLTGTVNTSSEGVYYGDFGYRSSAGYNDARMGVIFELTEQTNVVFNVASVVDGAGISTFSFRDYNTGEVLFSGEGNSVMEQTEMTLGPGVYFARTFMESRSVPSNPPTENMPDFASTSFEMTVVPSPSSVLALPIALGMVCRRRR